MRSTDKDRSIKETVSDLDEIVSELKVAVKDTEALTEVERETIRQSQRWWTKHRRDGGRSTEEMNTDRGRFLALVEEKEKQARPA